MDTVKKISAKLLLVLTTLFIAFNNIPTVHASDIILTFANDHIEETVSGSGYIITGTSLEITKAGTYRIKGSSNEGNIEVKKGVTGVTLILDNLTLASSKTAPIIIKKEGASATIRSVGISTITDNENPDDETSSNPELAKAFEGAGIKVNSTSSLTFTGTGTINVYGRAKNGVKGGSGSSITMNTGVLNIQAANTGLACDGTIDINNGMLAIDAYNEGIKLEPDEGDTTSLARLNITGGKIDINAGQDGIQAVGDINISGWPLISVNSLEDGIQTKSNFNMSNGDLTIHTFEGYNPSSFDKDAMSAKGIKASKLDEEQEYAPNQINITGGTINIDSSDDAIHSDGNMTITRGTVTVKSGDDAIHADTKLTIGTQGGLERDPEISVLESIEGIEAGNIYMYSGKVRVISLDDGMNAAGGASSGSGKEHGEHFNPDTGQMEDNYAIYVYGGSIFVTSEGDGLDANGSIYLYGGTQIIYHQDAQGNNSALDRDAKLVIDGATVLSAGGVADNGHVDDIGSNQKIIIDTTDYPANSKIVLKDGDTPIYNDQIQKRSTYTFYSSPTLSDNASISTTDELIDPISNPFDHNWGDGVITTPATPTSNGIMTYTCHEGPLQERKTYFYRDEVNLQFINKTNKQATVKLGNTQSDEDFVFNGGSEEYAIITSNQNIELINTYDGVNFDIISPDEVENNEYTFHINPSDSQTFYVILDGDISMDGIINFDDAALIYKSKRNVNNELYRPLTNLEQVIADINDNGLINSHDGLQILKPSLPETTTYEKEDFELSGDNEIILDGEHEGTITVDFRTTKAVNLDAIDGNFLPNEAKPSANGYLQLVSIEKVIDASYELNDSVNGFAGAVGNNMEIAKKGVLWRATYVVDKDTPTGAYPVTFRVNSVTAHDSSKEKAFVLTKDIIVKGTTDPITAFFSKDEGVSKVDVYYTQNYNNVDEENPSSTPIRDPDTGEMIGTTGEGQINFTVNLKPGYIVKEVSVSPNNYKNIKGPADTDKSNTYRITKVTGDIEIQIVTKQATEYTTTFIKDSHIDSIDIYHTQDYTNPDETDVETAYARNSDTGEVDISGDGQINFKVNPAQGYKVESVEVSGTYKNLKEQKNRIYRVTKIAGDLLITVKSSVRTQVTPEVTGYETSYTYTGSKIKPDIVVTVPGEEPITLVKGTDYTVTYGDNNEVGENTGTITITSVDSSNYIFEPIVKHFDITKYTLTMDNITKPSSIVYTGNPLTPQITVSVGGKTLVKDTDYEITYTNKDGQVGEYVTATVTGKGNYTGVVNNINVLITDKAPQFISFPESEVTKVYGEGFTMTATITQGDGTIRYTSNNTQAATVDENTGEITLIGTGQATIRAFASETDAYAQAVTSYKLIVKKAPLTIQSMTIEDKSYDGTKKATVSNVVFSGLVKNETLQQETDYTVDAQFDNKEIGNNKEVTAVVDLSTEVIKRYTLEGNTYHGTANITNGVIKEENITLSQNTYTYDGTEKKPNVTVKIGDITLEEGTDYTVEYKDNINAGESKVIVKGTGSYNTTVEKTFTINKKAVTPTISPISDQTYNAGEQRPKLTVSDSLEEKKDYVAEYKDNIDAGVATVTIKPVENGNYTFTETSSTFTIKPYEIKAKDIALSYKMIKHDGSAKEPEVTVVANQVPLIKDVNYRVTYTNNTSVGTATVKVKAISNNYTGEPTVNFEITDKDILTISGIENQNVVYTGNPVELQGNLTVTPNTISPSDLTIKYYNSSNEVIEKPTNVGKYYVIYSYSDSNYKGELKVEFNITKATSTNPQTERLNALANDKLSTITLQEGLTWKDPNETIKPGENYYKATYTKNNDTTNYTTINVEIPVYGKRKIDIKTSVNGTGGTVSGAVDNVLEGTVKTITITPNEGYEIDRVTVNGKVVIPQNNKLQVTAGVTDINVVVSFNSITYSLNVSGSNVETDPQGIIEVNQNANKTVSLNTKFGYRLTSVKVNGEEKINEVENDTLTLNSITTDENIVVKAEKIIYEVIEGARQTYTITTSKDAPFKINADYSLFQGNGKVEIDNKEIGKENYTSKEGSTVIIFNQRFMDTLKVGTHTLTVTFNDGGNAYTTFNVSKVTEQEKIGPNNKKGSPNTGDNILTIILVFFISLFGLITVVLLTNRDSLKHSTKYLLKILLTFSIIGALSILLALIIKK